MVAVPPSSDRAPDDSSSGKPDTLTAAAPALPIRLPAALRALGHRNYRLFFSGQLISLIGTWMQSVAQSWLVYRLTGSSMLLGFVGFASQFPVFLLAPLGGAAADRHNRHSILVVTQTSSMVLALALAAATLSGHVAISHIFVLAALMGCVNAFDIPARQAFVVDMVGRADLINAIALNSSVFNGARILGPAIAGVLVAAIGEGWCFLGNGISYLAVIAGLLLMRIPMQQARASRGSAFSEIVAGFRFVGRTAPVLSLILLVGLVSLAGMPYTVLMPVVVDRVLQGGPGALGALMGSSGLGALAGAAALAARKGVRGLGTWVAGSATGLGIALILFSMSRVFWLSAVLLLPVGFCMIVQMASSNTLIQSMVPDELRGRVMSVYSMVFMGMAPLGALIAGFLAGGWGAPRTIALGGMACLVGAGVFWLRLPALRVEARQLIETQQQEFESRPEPELE